MVKGCDGFFECWSDLVGAAFEVDGVGGADFSGGSKGEVEIEQGSGRTRAQGGVGPFWLRLRGEDHGAPSLPCRTRTPDTL